MEQGLSCLLSSFGKIRQQIGPSCDLRARTVPSLLSEARFASKWSEVTGTRTVLVLAPFICLQNEWGGRKDCPGLRFYLLANQAMNPRNKDCPVFGGFASRHGVMRPKKVPLTR